MDKRTDAQIFIVAHKPVEYGLWDNKLYTPIQVGFAEQFTPLRDNTYENIADWNDLFAELCAHYWIANNIEDLETVGVCQYRRRFDFPLDLDFNTILKDHYAIAPRPLQLGCTVRQQYEACHCKRDIDEVEKL